MRIKIVRNRYHMREGTHGVAKGCAPWGRGEGSPWNGQRVKQTCIN